MMRGEELPPPPEEGTPPVSRHLRPEAGSAIDIIRGYRPGAFRERVEDPEQIEARETYNRIYNACILDKSTEVDMGVVIVAGAVYETCREIADNPSWLDSLRYE